MINGGTMSTIKWLSYPRPQLRRDSYINLNGTWTLDGQEIQVPFAPQCELSGYKGEVGEHLTYIRKFACPPECSSEKGSRAILHFGAVDEVCEVYVNDVHIGKHEGGYLHFSFDITDALIKEALNVLRVEVTDTLSRVYPYGKQCKKRGGMWYTPISGIWQTVWMEVVPKQYIKEIKLTPSMTDLEISVIGNVDGFKATVLDEGQVVAEQNFAENTGKIVIPNPILWDTENPHLYDLKIEAGEDKIDSYFALRTVEIKKVDKKQ